MKTPKPRVVSVRRQAESIEDEAPTIPLFRPMATQEQQKPATEVFCVRPSWLDVPFDQLAPAMARAAIAAIPAAIVISITITMASLFVIRFFS